MTIFGQNGSERKDEEKWRQVEDEVRIREIRRVNGIDCKAWAIGIMIVLWEAKTGMSNVLRYGR